MDSTTLVTFLYKSRPEVRTVELFGSWDNFSRPYRMQSDGHRGRGVWTGCHSFENIICDGDRINHLRPRNGALRQGGTYWYYYKVDDSEEACDTATSTTYACPLLPGQMVNVLEIPIEVIEAPQRVCSASADLPTTMVMPMTINPEDRYKKIYSKPPTKLPRYYCSSDALRERFASDSRLPKTYRIRDRPSSRGARSIKRVRRDEPEYQRPGACRIDVSMDDMSRLANIPDLDQNMNELPELRPFAPCPSASPEERPVTRGGGGLFTDLTKGLGFSFFGSLRQPKKNTHHLSQDINMEFDDSPQHIPQYDGTYDEPQISQWPLSPPLSELADEENWPLPPLNCFRPASSHTPLHGPSTPTSAIPILNLNNQPQTQHPSNFPQQHFTSPALSSSITSDDYHPGFGPSKSIPGSFDMASPTFSADTLDSSFSSSLTTPDHFRLSFNLDASNHGPQDSELTASNFSTGLEDLSNRLSALYTSPPSSSAYDDDFGDCGEQENKKIDFLSFLPQRAAPLYLQNVQARRSRSSSDYEKSNGSCLTLKSVKSTTARGERPFSLCLPVTAGEWDVGEEFSSDVLGALGMV
ncbi:hypothetical protein AUEXF2481DRAFT_3270 [Aureobasidium subglaciale EXF-2481]|uniref:Uncharacterized protein n=1 Tax=Aureobasidium subglaciale (strain EXF-2481) TaxID=1043005 RepID=A0A074YI13_AURSE|nr:uncharacterized protein AUEXF2481DRAFT_3270 [Aureobasidium subglaciale EXF-2481]KAI5197847.1 hypothetical protein E4T38_07825 [Aureobasidium subglaciale]KAI5216636.1 hypothetical protein E4T40_07835 [Aureobasidium subglaciale]KAI5219966.1 hypothetical protein E4T41_07750 [Aureobasidium subglaciale]KAI5257783.1 hypothetical protein E4T46_07726 [Aureobasidium subglaciale]KEQ97463.1 hypothetical protein AUEXF2481DRAFT_3270 [Aureobasidium subglaciale EXF-2481]